MKIAIASGKGGTGKTTLATNLALMLAQRNLRVVYRDCDVEEPNGHLFLKPQITDRITASIPVPVIDGSKCTACGACARFCEYKALARLGPEVMVFPELCHGCGGCTLICPQRAIREEPRGIGTVEWCSGTCLRFVHGRLDVGKAMSPPLIRKVLGVPFDADVEIVDAPPGTSCPVIAAIRSMDYIVLVTEPTPFGLNDLGLALDMVRELNIPHGVVVNRDEAANLDARHFCDRRQVPIIACIPDDRRIAQAYSRGEMILTAVDGVQEIFDRLWQSLQREVGQ